MANTYLTKTFSGAGNTKKWTWSAWVKKSQESSSSTYNQVLFGTAGGSYDTIAFQTTPNTPKFFASISGNFERSTNALHRDCNGWYHLVVTFDSAQGTAADRLKLYVNGVQQSSFADNTNGNQNDDSYINTTDAHQIGKQAGLSRYFDGVMSHVHFCDGYAYAASSFGSTDTTTGEWRINTNPSVSYGTNGFFILKDGNSVTDQSGNSNNFTVAGGTLTKTEDNPSNVFATMNALQYSPSTEFSNGNLTVKQNAGTGAHRRFTATLGALSGKYYWEVKLISSITDGCTIGIVDGVNGDYSTFLGQNSNEWGYNLAGDIYHNASAYQSGLPTYTNGNIINIALDLDNNYIYFGKNGTWINSGVPTSGATGTGGYAITDNIIYHPAISLFVNTATASFNFGNGYFGTTAVSSAGTNASGIGIFEYDVPTGYTALSTKGLNL